MNTDRILIGNVMCQDFLVGEAVFIKVGKKYFYLEDINHTLDLLKAKCNISSIRPMSTVNNGLYYIDENSLIPYYDVKKNKTLTKIKLDVLTDSRNSKGINN